MHQGLCWRQVYCVQERYHAVNCNKTCDAKSTCNGHGQCSGLMGMCTCFEGWSGDDCSQRQGSGHDGDDSDHDTTPFDFLSYASDGLVGNMTARAKMAGRSILTMQDFNTHGKLC